MRHPEQARWRSNQRSGKLLRWTSRHRGVQRDDIVAQISAGAQRLMLSSVERCVALRAHSHDSATVVETGVLVLLSGWRTAALVCNAAAVL